MIIGARTGAWAKSGGRVPTAKDYVQDGLVGFYDSIENLGPGKSDDSGNVVEWISGNVNTGMRNNIFSNKTPAVLEAWKTKYKTVEICVKDTYFSGNSGNKNFLYGNYIAQLSFQIRKTEGKNPFVYVFFDMAQPGSDLLGDANFCGTLTVCRNGDEVRYYRDFDITQKIISATNDPIELINIRIPSSDAVLSFVPCRVSVYNRALTAEEISHNYEIDKERFGIGG